MKKKLSTVASPICTMRCRTCSKHERPTFRHQKVCVHQNGRKTSRIIEPFPCAIPNTHQPFCCDSNANGTQTMLFHMRSHRLVRCDSCRWIYCVCRCIHSVNMYMNVHVHMCAQLRPCVCDPPTRSRPNAAARIMGLFLVARRSVRRSCRGCAMRMSFRSIFAPRFCVCVKMAFRPLGDGCGGNYERNAEGDGRRREKNKRKNTTPAHVVCLCAHCQRPIRCVCFGMFSVHRR